MMGYLLYKFHYKDGRRIYRSFPDRYAFLEFLVLEVEQVLEVLDLNGQKEVKVELIAASNS